MSCQGRIPVSFELSEESYCRDAACGRDDVSRKDRESKRKEEASLGPGVNRCYRRRDYVSYRR